jgi:hypothetical protein
MSIKAKLAVVSLAEADCAVRRATVAAAWRGLKQEGERAATPGRVVGAGLIAGFVSGLAGSGSKGPGSAIGGKLFAMLLEGGLSSFTAAMAAGAAVGDVQQGADAADSSATVPDTTASNTAAGRG